MRKLFICLFTLVSTVTLAQQTSLNGKIIDRNGKPVTNATVYLLNSYRGTYSDASGNFSFDKLDPGKYELQVSAIGFATHNEEITVDKQPGQPTHFKLLPASIQLEAVYVSAEKKDAFLQKIPVSISALSARQVADFRLWNTRDLSAIVPNLYTASSGDERNVTGIRGIATTSYDQAVTTYIDGVNQFSLDTYIAQLSDIERIEVLRGPQGTLYGRNAMGGVINIITRQPGNKLNGFAELSAGNHGQLRISAGIRVPVVKNKLFIGMSNLYDKNDGFYRNTFNNASFDKKHAFLGNYYIKYMPGSKWSVLLNVKFLQNRNQGAFPMVNSINEAFADPFVLNQDAISTMIDNSMNSSLSVNYTGRGFNVSSQTAYQTNYRYYDKPLDGDFSPIDGVTVINNFGKDWNKVKVFTEEIRFTNPAHSDSKLKWTAGVYFFQQDNPGKQAVHFGKDALWVGAPDTDFSITNVNKGKSTGIAFFGQAGYAITKKLSVIAGLRYDHENKKYNVLGQYSKDPDPTPLFDTRPDTSASASFHAVSPRFGLAYAVQEHINAFLNYSRGFRTGGLTSLSSDPSQPPLYPYEPEYSDNIELGIKNNFLNNRLQVNITAFYTQVTNAQVPTLVLPDAVTVTKNAGKLSSRGIECEISALLVKGLQADYHFGYTDAHYENLKLSQNGSSTNLDGKKQVFTPESTSMLALQYNISLGRKQAISLLARGEWFYTGKQYFDLANTISQRDYSILNIRFGITYRYASLMFWGRNLANKKYIAYAYDFGAIHLGDPQTAGATLSVNF